MKLLMCGHCGDVFSLRAERRSCVCGQTHGQMLDRTNGTYRGERAIPIGFANPSLHKAIEKRPDIGQGKEFVAFVIPRKCPTFIKEE